MGVGVIYILVPSSRVQFEELHFEHSYWSHVSALEVATCNSYLIPLQEVKRIHTDKSIISSRFRSVFYVTRQQCNYHI